MLYHSWIGFAQIDFRACIFLINEISSTVRVAASAFVPSAIPMERPATDYVTGQFIILVETE